MKAVVRINVNQIINTQPALVLRFEAMTEERLEEIRSLMEGVLAKMQKQ